MSTSISKTGLPIIIIVVAIAAAAAMIALKQEPEKKEPESRSFLVDAKPILSEDVEFLVYAQGAVQPKHKTMLSTQVSGRVIEVSEKFTEGGFFKKGEVLLSLESDDYTSDLLLAEAELARAQASLDEEIARGRVAEKEWSSVNSGQRPELGLRKPQLAREQANVKAASANLARAKRNLSRTKITAPYDGLVKSRLVDLGQFVAMGTQLGEVFSTSTAEVRLPLTDNDLAFLGDMNTSARHVTLSADVAGKKHFWQGKLVRDEAVLDEARRVSFGVVEVQDPYNLISTEHASPLKFGRFVSAAVSGMIAQDIVKLPRSVIRLDGTVLSVDEEQKISINSVEIMRADEDYVYISGGLPTDHLVVMSAVSTPYNGMPVRFTEDEPTKPINSEDEQQDKAITEVSL
jgi:RND family efflux transporter MFP subunit